MRCSTSYVSEGKILDRFRNSYHPGFLVVEDMSFDQMFYNVMYKVKILGRRDVFIMNTYQNQTDKHSGLLSFELALIGQFVSIIFFYVVHKTVA